MNDGLFSSKRSDWKTPKSFYAVLDKIFNFDFDPCPTNPDFDGLSIEWKSSNFVNPPYGSAIAEWVKKSFLEGQKGKTVVLLIPSRTDTRYWHQYVMKAREIWFVKGRLDFDDTGGRSPFPSVVVIFGKADPNSEYPIIRSLDSDVKERQIKLFASAV